MPEGPGPPGQIAAQVDMRGAADAHSAVSSSLLPTRPWVRVGYAACLVLFPLVWAIFAGTGLHPDPEGATAAEQVRAVAASAEAWRWVHIVLAGGGLLGMGTVFGLRMLLPRAGALAAVGSVAAAVGAAAAGVVAGIVFTEASLVAPVAEACARSSACLSSENDAFLQTFANASWNDLPALSIAAGTLLFAVGTLGVLGWRNRSVRAWEAILISSGSSASTRPTPSFTAMRNTGSRSCS